MEAVNKDHEKLSSKYNFLLHTNDYIAKLAEQMITVVELNSCLLVSDEADKNSICLLGTQGPKTVQEQSHDMHIHRLQNQLDEIEKGDGRPFSGTLKQGKPA